MSVHHIFRCERSIWAVLDLEDSRRFDDFDGVPLAPGYLHAVVSRGGVKKETVSLCAGLVIENNEHLATKHDVCLGSMAMAVNR